MKWKCFISGVYSPDPMIPSVPGGIPTQRPVKSLVDLLAVAANVSAVQLRARVVVRSKEEAMIPARAVRPHSTALDPGNEPADAIC